MNVMTPRKCYERTSVRFPEISLAGTLFITKVVMGISVQRLQQYKAETLSNLRAQEHNKSHYGHGQYAGEQGSQTSVNNLHPYRYSIKTL